MAYYCIFAVPSDLDSLKQVGLLSKILTDRGVGLGLAGLRKDTPPEKKKTTHVFLNLTSSQAASSLPSLGNPLAWENRHFLGFVVGMGVRAMSYPQHHHPLPSTGGLPGNMFLLPALLKSALEISITHWYSNIPGNP